MFFLFVIKLCSEKVTVPSGKTYITFKGAGASLTTIQWGDDANKAGSTSKSASVIILADYFIAEDIAFKVLYFKPHNT